MGFYLQKSYFHVKNKKTKGVFVLEYVKLAKTMGKNGVNPAQISYENTLCSSTKTTQSEENKVLETLSPETIKNIVKNINKAIENGFYETTYIFNRDNEDESILFTQHGINTESVNILILAFNILGYKIEFTLNTHRDKLKLRIIWHLY